jgi:hypothetical protein
MKLKLLSLIWITAVLPILGVAAPPPSPAPSAVAVKTDSAKPPAAVDEKKMDVATLGRMDAVLTLCAKADDKNRASYERIHTEMIAFGEGTPYAMRVKGSDTPEYKAAYAEAIEAAGKASKEELAGQCSRMIGAETANTEK